MAEEFPKAVPTSLGGPAVAATVTIEMLENGSFRCTFPDNVVVGMGMLEIAKDIFLSRVKESSQRRIQPAFGPLPNRQ